MLRDVSEALSDLTTLRLRLFNPLSVSFTFCKNLKSFSISTEGKDIKKIIDVGANEGQFLFMAKYCWPHAQIDCFEPDPNPFKCLERKYRRYQNVYFFNYALGSQSGELPLILGATSAQNSFLVEHGKSTNGEISVPVKTLNEIYSEKDLSNTLLKIDTQGYEKQILEGGSEILDKLRFILLEVSLADLFDSGSKLDEIWFFLRQRGYVYNRVIDQYKDPKTDQIVQMDIVFENSNILC